MDVVGAARSGPGYRATGCGPDGISPTAFGHTGAGGFTAYADPAHDLAFAVCKTYVLAQIDPVSDPAHRFERELHATLLS